MDESRIRPTGELPHDDVDALFARLLAPAAPEDFVEMTVAAAVAARRARRRSRWLWLVLDAVATLALAYFSFDLGWQLAESGAIEYLEMFALEGEMLLEAPLEAAIALLEMVPWRALTLVLLALLAIGLVTRTLVSLGREAIGGAPVAGRAGARS